MLIKIGHVLFEQMAKKFLPNLLNHQGAGMMMSSVSQQMVIDQPHQIKEAPPQATLRWHIEDAVQNSGSK